MKTLIAALLAIPALAFAGPSENLASTSRQLFTAALTDIPAANKPLLPQDAFMGIESCAIVDAKPIRAFSLPEVYKHLGPCMKEVSKRYQAAVNVKIGVVQTAANADESDVFGIIVWVPASAFPGTPLHRDLSRALMLRKGRLMGQPASLRRENEAESSARSYIQESLDKCFLPTVIRPLNTGADFVKYYGRCITQDKELQITQIQPSTDPDRTLAVVVVTAGDEGMVESLNGFVTVNGGMGKVNVAVFANPAVLHLP